MDAQNTGPLHERDFALITELVHEHAAARPAHVAVVQYGEAITYAELDATLNRVAASLQRDGLRPGDTLAICAANSIPYLCAFLGALRAGLCVVPLAVTTTPEAVLDLIQDAGSKLLLLDAGVDALARLVAARIPGLPTLALDESAAAGSFGAWLADAPQKPEAVALGPADPFNIIYSSGTTGKPKGIVQSHKMRWGYVRDFGRVGYGPDTVLIVATPFYSNLCLGSLFPVLALGGTAVLMGKFDALHFLQLAERHRATDAMLVPVQVQRIMALAEFDRFDLSSFRTKFCAGAPFNPALKAEVLRRWPGGLIEFYGMTEGGGTCCLFAHKRPDKIHTVGQPVGGHDMRIIDDEDRELPIGEVGEIVGSSGQMMLGYRNQQAITAKTIWTSPEGKDFIRTGDIGRFDSEGFLQIVDRKKDMIISGGFNIYPSDIEAILARHEDVQEAAVTGVPSAVWGETPVAFVVQRPGRAVQAAGLREWVNARLGKTQRLADLVMTTALPRNGLGKILKSELRNSYSPPGTQSP